MSHSLFYWTKCYPKCYSEFLLDVISLEFGKFFNLTILTGKIRVLLIRNGCLAASDLFHIFTQSVKFYAFSYHVLKSTDV